MGGAPKADLRLATPRSSRASSPCSPGSTSSQADFCSRSSQTQQQTLSFPPIPSTPSSPNCSKAPEVERKLSWRTCWGSPPPTPWSSSTRSLERGWRERASSRPTCWQWLTASSPSLNNGFQSDIREFDFNSNSLGSVQEINRYVEDVTNQKIKDLLADDDVDGLTRMVLINAVYFKANWQFAFNADETFESSFSSPEGSVSTQYMNREAEVRMLVDKERQLQILELPYEDPNRSMLIVLPNAGTSTQDLVQRIGGLDLASIRTNGKLAKTSIFIPKFKLKFKTYLKQQMEALGVRDLFAQSAN